jgi:hypothetical protein
MRGQRGAGDRLLDATRVCNGLGITGIRGYDARGAIVTAPQVVRLMLHKGWNGRRNMTVLALHSSPIAASDSRAS